MSVVKLIIKELVHRKLNALLSIVAILTATALFVGYFTLAEASRRETTRVTRDIGFNLRIIPKDSDMDQFWSSGYSDRTMPEETVRRFAKADGVFFAYNHLVASLQRKWSLNGKDVLLTGLAPAITAPGQAKQPMGFAIKPGTLFLGWQVAQRLDLKKGGTLGIEGRTFKIVQTLTESGTDDDIRVFGALPDVQRILGLAGQINEIKAIDCLCLTTDQDPLQKLRAELAKTLPEAKVVQLRAIADARARQRQMVDKYVSFSSPALLAGCAVWVGLLALMNVRERRGEIGILRALGRGSGQIALLFLAKAAVLGLIGATLGYAAGSMLAVQAGPEIFKVTAKSIHAELRLLLWAIFVAPLFAGLASFIPAMLAVAEDPAVTLREE
jgi:putative ABC transport system permease protein